MKYIRARTRALKNTRVVQSTDKKKHFEKPAYCVAEEKSFGTPMIVLWRNGLLFQIRYQIAITYDRQIQLRR